MGARPGRLEPGARVVIDTGVVVSALVFAGGELDWLRRAWQTRRLRPCVSRETAAEFLRVLAYPKFRLSAPERDDLLADYLPYCEAAEAAEGEAALPDCRDPFDRPFLALALAVHAAALITSDSDLLAVTSDFSIPILRPADLRPRLD